MKAPTVSHQKLEISLWCYQIIFPLLTKKTFSVQNITWSFFTIYTVHFSGIFSDIQTSTWAVNLISQTTMLSPWHTADKNRPILSADKNWRTNVGRFFAVTRSIFCRSILSSAWCLQNDRFVRGWSVGSFLLFVRAKQKRKKNRTIWERPWISRR